ncbi:MAG: hypothetical protein MUC38_03425 [Cyclobacteriaceae bacterium]|jgi:opacity protein-like surface antigen|nr:hypothetical protein [Cyclobacteriaceae bacterium]
MKKLLLVWAVCSGLVAQAQVEKGDRSITYAVSYVSTENFRFGLATAKFGRFFTDRLEIGMKPSFNLGGGGDLKLSGLGLGVYFSYNFLTEDGKMLPYVSGEVGSKYNYTIVGDDFDSETHQTNVDAGLALGTKYFFTDRLNLDISVNYLFNVYNGFAISDGDPVEDPDFPDTFSLNVGIGFLINKR